MYLYPIQYKYGAYPPAQSTPFDGAIELTDEQAQMVVDYNGYVTITQTENSVEVTPNLEAWETWKKEEENRPTPVREPTVTEILNALLGYEEEIETMNNKFTVNGNGGGVIPFNTLYSWEVAA